mgnify:CR=1 FL=1
MLQQWESVFHVSETVDGQFDDADGENGDEYEGEDDEEEDGGEPMNQS